jgi:hypothetical protein
MTITPGHCGFHQGVLVRGFRCARRRSILSPFYRRNVVLARAGPAIIRPQASVTERENAILVAPNIPQDRFFEHWLIPWAP